MGYEPIIGTSFAKVGRLGVENNCCRQTLHLFIYFDVISVCMIAVFPANLDKYK